MVCQTPGLVRDAAIYTVQTGGSEEGHESEVSFVYAPMHSCMYVRVPEIHVREMVNI
jgi:hypothetical protein